MPRGAIAPQHTYSSKQQRPWGIVLAIVAIGTILLLAVVGAVSIFNGSSDSGGNQNNQQSGDSQSAWFQTHHSAIASAQADLESKQARMADVKSGFLDTRCDGKHYPAQCEEVWKDSSSYEVENTKVTRADAHVKNLIAEYDTEAKAANLPPYAP